MAATLQRVRAMRAGDLLVQSLVLFLAGVAAAIVVVIGVYLFLESAPLLTGTGLLGFFRDQRWYPLEGEFGMAAMLAGTLSVTALAMLLAAPVGIAAAVFIRYYAPPAVARFYRRLLELLSGIPSVVFGFWGLVVLVPLIAKLEGPGASVLAGGLVLGLMILPLVSLSTDSSLAQVPRQYWVAGTALGLGRWAIVRKVMIPAAASGILAGMVLQTGRALGETMAVLMVTGNVVQLPASVFEPVRALTSNIALEMAYATGDHRTALFVSGLILLLMAVGLVALAALIQRRLRRYA
jgi:phosphate transport system permease protein